MRRMAVINFFLLTICAISIVESAKLVCYFNGAAVWRKGIARVTASSLEPILDNCNYLVYGYVGVNTSTYRAESLDHELDEESGKNYFKRITSLKQSFPKLKVLLSVGGYVDYSLTEKYLRLLENSANRQNFICSIKSMVKNYGFDGVDLAWQFPPTAESKETTPTTLVFDAMIKYSTFFVTDNTPSEHRNQFVELCKELKAALQMDKLILTLSILPHVDFKQYYDKDHIGEYVEHINLMTYDYRMPDRIPHIADYSAPRMHVNSEKRNPDQNMEATLNWWLNSTIPAKKLLISVPTYGRAWRLLSVSDESGVPPLLASGPGEAGPLLHVEGIWAYYEICNKLVSGITDRSSGNLKRVLDPVTYQGNYAFRPASGILSTGLWISYEEPRTAQYKAEYALYKGLGGVAIVDLSLDDTKASCAPYDTKFPILKAVRSILPPEIEMEISTSAFQEKSTEFISTNIPEFSTESFPVENSEFVNVSMVQNKSESIALPEIKIYSTIPLNQTIVIPPIVKKKFQNFTLVTNFLINLNVIYSKEP